MEVEFQLLDADYTLVNNRPTVRLFGKTSDKKSITVFVDNFLPYFYVLPSEDGGEKLV
jgi:DNA polymerase I